MGKQATSEPSGEDYGSFIDLIVNSRGVEFSVRDLCRQDTQ